MTELAILFPTPETISVLGRKVELRPVLLRDFERYGNEATSVLELLSTASVQQINAYATKNAGQLRRLLRATTSLNRWQLLRMPASTALEVFVQVMRVNIGFFEEALPGMVRALNGAQSFNA